MELCQRIQLDPVDRAVSVTHTFVSSVVLLTLPIDGARPINFIKIKAGKPLGKIFSWSFVRDLRIKSSALFLCRTDQSIVSTMIQKSHGCEYESLCLSHLSFFSSAQDIFSRSCTSHQRASLFFPSSFVHHSNGSLIHAFVSFCLAYVRSIGKKVDAPEGKRKPISFSFLAFDVTRALWFAYHSFV